MNTGIDGSEPALEPGYMSLLLSNSSKRQVFLIGTCHASNVSAAQVRSAISAVDPDGVMVSTGLEWARLLRHELRSAAYSQEQGFTKTLLKMIQRRSDPLRFIRFTLIKEMFRLIGFVPPGRGDEFKVALDECDTRGIPVINGDINISTTMAGVRHEMASFDLRRFAEGQKSKSLLTNGFLDSVSACSPGLAKVVVHERDQHMANNLINGCGNAERIIAVVELMHMDGIEKLWRLDGGTVLHMGNPDHT